MNIRDVLKSKNKLVIGKEQVFKLLKLNKLEQIMLSSNSAFVEETKRLASMSKTKVSVSKHPSKELGALLKKPFSITILGLKK